MQHTRTVLTTGALLLVGALLADPATAQPAPFGHRNSLIITELSPYARPDVVAWIEVHNPRLVPESLADLVIERADATRYTIPAGTGVIPAGGFLVVRFDDSPQPAPPSSGSPRIVHVPQSLAPRWLPPHGELALLRRLPSLHGDFGVVDHVAWGEGATPKPPSNGLRRWPPGTFVPLAEGFGVYNAETTLVSGASIGLYPRTGTSTRADWVIFDPDETTPGEPNNVPRLKAFTLPPEAHVGSRSFAVGWASRRGDEWYRFQLSPDQLFNDLLIDESSVTPSIRVGKTLRPGRYFYRAMAFAGDMGSAASHIQTLSVVATVCDSWGADPNTLRNWIDNPTCGSLPDCQLVSSIRFKFQRKDTPLLCLKKQGWQCDRYSSPGWYPCEWDHPHKYSQFVTFFVSPGQPPVLLVAGDPLSRTCHKNLPPVPAVMLPWFWIGHCEHGQHYCAMASVSMMASAYGACLSQDRIAYHIRQGEAGLDWGELAHNKETLPDDIDQALKWALGMSDSLVQVNPDPSIIDTSAIPNQPAFEAAHFDAYAPSPRLATFQTLRLWVGAQRPIMCLSGNHARVVLGFCRDLEDREWLYIYDPVAGPVLEDFGEWLTKSMVGLSTHPARDVWVGPSVSEWQQRRRVRSDEYSVWSDWDNDGIMDFDELRRFSTSPFAWDDRASVVGPPD